MNMYQFEKDKPWRLDNLWNIQPSKRHWEIVLFARYNYTIKRQMEECAGCLIKGNACFPQKTLKTQKIINLFRIFYSLLQEDQFYLV